MSAIAAAFTAVLLLICCQCCAAAPSPPPAAAAFVRLSAPRWVAPNATFDASVEYDLPFAARLRIDARDAASQTLRVSSRNAYLQPGRGVVKLDAAILQGSVAFPVNASAAEPIPAREVELIAVASPFVERAASSSSSLPAAAASAVESAPVTIGVLAGPQAEGLYWDFPLSLSGFFSRPRGGRPGDGESAGAWALNLTTVAAHYGATTAYALPESWGVGLRSAITTSTSDASSTNAIVLDLASGYLLVGSRRGKKKAFSAVPPPPSIDDFLARSCGLRCGAYASALEDAARAAGEYKALLAAALPSVSAVARGASVYKDASPLFEVEMYLNAVQAAVGELQEAYTAAASAERVRHPRRPPSPQSPPSSTQATPAPMTDLARRLTRPASSDKC